MADQWTIVTKDRSLAAHFEHTVALWDDGPEILSVTSTSEVRSRTRSWRWKPAWSPSASTASS